MQPRMITWKNFVETVLLPGQQRLHVFSQKPEVLIYADGENGQIGLRIQSDSSGAIPADLASLKTLHFDFVSFRGRTYLEVTCQRAELQAPFFHFAQAVTERVGSEGLSAIDAVSTEILCFDALVAQSPRMGTEREIGLFGEMLFLEYLIEQHGPAAVKSWIGPLGEPHDFRIGEHEFEVKTTTSSTREHTINGIRQLVPSHGCTLAVISVLLGPPAKDAGRSLAGVVRDIEDRLTSEVQSRGLFSDRLTIAGVPPDARTEYQRQFTLRRPMGTVRVDSGVPVISQKGLEAMLGKSAYRISEVVYSLNLDGLVAEHGSDDWKAIVEAKEKDQ